MMDIGNKALWYILHTYSGYEKLVKASLEQMAVNNNLEDSLLKVRILTQTVVGESNGKRKVYESKMMPCYVYVKLVYSSELAYLINNTRGVTGFVGPNGQAMPISDDEVARFKLDEEIENVELAVGDNVTVIDGPFTGMIGVIKSLDVMECKAKVVINMLGRDTEVDMLLEQINKIVNNVVTEQ